VNVLNVTGRITNDVPVSPLYTVGEMKSVHDLIVTLQEKITRAFFIDRLLDLNNETRMTAYETQIRNKLRGESLGTLFARQEAELLTPMISRTLHILLKRGYLGVLRGSPEEAQMVASGRIPRFIPEAIAAAAIRGEDVYRINYISPAKRVMQAEEVQGVMTAINFAVESVGIAPEAVDNIDVDAAIKLIAVHTGSPETIIRDMQSVKALRQARAAQQARAQQIEETRIASEIGRNAAQARQVGMVPNGMQNRPNEA
jgi:hypothetical protein